MTTMNPSVCGSNERSKVAKDVESCLGSIPRKEVATSLIKSKIKVDSAPKMRYNVYIS